MSRDIELLTVLNRIMRTVRESESHASEPLASFTDASALNQILGLASAGVGLLGRDGDGAAIAMTDPRPQSSVEIERRVKGPPGVKVKVYDASPTQALARAMDLYATAIGEYAEAARVKSEEAS